MKKKYLRVTMNDGSRWDIPAEVIAKDRSEYYAKRDADNGEGEYNLLYDEEMDYILSNDDELKDWASNNMNWSEVKEHAKKVEEPSDIDWEDGWCNGNKKVVEKDE